MKHMKHIKLDPRYSDSDIKANATLVFVFACVIRANATLVFVYVRALNRETQGAYKTTSKILQQ